MTITMITWGYVTGLPFSSEVNPEAASTFSNILLSFITLVAQTYPCLPDTVSNKLVKLPHFLQWHELGFFAPQFIQVTITNDSILYIYMHPHAEAIIANKQLLLNLQYLKDRIRACI